MRFLNVLGIVLIILTVAIALVREALHHNSDSPLGVTANPPSQSTVTVITAFVPPEMISQPQVAPPVVPHDVGYNGVFEGASGLQYEFSQIGSRIDLHLLNPDGRRRYVGTAYDEGDWLRFESFYSPIYQKWGRFPPMRRQGDTLVSESRDGTQRVYFTRVR